MPNFLSSILQILQYDFMLNALIVGIFIGITCSFLGLFLVLKRYALIGDGLAHVSFASIAIALFFSASSLFVSIPLVIIAAIIILKLNEKANIHGDTAIGLVASTSIALGIIISSISNGFNVDILSYLFGSILVISKNEIISSIILTISVISVFIIFYNQLFAVIYDEDFARVIGIRIKLLNYSIAILTAITISIGVRVIGTMLISSLLIFPTVTALQFRRGFKATLTISVLVSVICIIVGLLASFGLNLPSGATIIMINAIIFLFAFLINKH